MCTCLYTGLHLISVTLVFGGTVIPVELKCNVTGVVVAWRVNNKYYSLTDLTNGVLPYHGLDGTNLLFNYTVNNTEYICVSTTSDGDVSGDPAYIINFGE